MSVGSQWDVGGFYAVRRCFCIVAMARFFTFYQQKNGTMILLLYLFMKSEPLS